MDILILIFVILTSVFSLLALIFALKASKKDNNRDNAILEGKIDTLSGTVSNEMAHNRQENLQMMNNIGVKISDMSEKNLNMQHKITSAVSESLSEMKTANAQQNEKIITMLTSSIDKMTEKNEKKLEEMRATVDEKLTSTLTQRLDSSFKTVSGQLEKLYTSLGEMKELSNGVTANVTSLNRVLTNVKARGTWAEVQLGAILDQTIPGMYETNFVCVPGSKDRVEFAVHIPSSDGGEMTYLPIDSKFPMEDYVRLCDAADSAAPVALEAARSDNNALGLAPSNKRASSLVILTISSI